MSKIKDVQKLIESLDNVNEVSNAEFDELSKDKQDFLIKYGFTKSTGMFDSKSVSYFKNVVQIEDNPKSISGNTFRMDKDDLKAIISDPSFRYIDVRAVGF